MRFLVPLCVFLAVAAFHSALSASLESADKEEEVAQHDGITELKKIDQMEFEAAQKVEAAQMNVTEEQNEETRYLEAAQDGSVEEQIDAEDDNPEGGGNSDASAHEGERCSRFMHQAVDGDRRQFGKESQSESSEEAGGESVTLTFPDAQEAAEPETVSSSDVLE
uniref:uncharacterized protein LOC120832296 isoform X2 n=1 Tax=Gasterosteus aculeatus aculeatus TaxID=481459 RepID=UPI001A99E03E|nr:uncharacterized protein LOC120832296 isoform X2 [Gasterosteus aculeatus aculeatus]